MTTEDVFTREELDELINALDTRRQYRAGIYAKPGQVTADWQARDKAICDLRDKIIGMKKS